MNLYFFSVQSLSKSLITWRISARAEISALLGGLKLCSKSEIAREESRENKKMRRKRMSKLAFQPRAEILFRLHEIFSDFLARLPGLKILARFEQTGLGFSAGAESLSM